jgi:RHS repeat-associated protein
MIIGLRGRPVLSYEHGAVNSRSSNTFGTATRPLFWPQPETVTRDADGNLTSDSLWTNRWDAENRRTVIESTAGLPPAAQRREQWTLLPDGRWIERIVSTNNGTAYFPAFTNRYVWDGQVLLAVLDGENHPVVTLMRGLDLSGTMQGAGGVGGLLAVSLRNEGTHFVCYDGNGNVVALVNAADGSESGRYEYGPFGEPVRVTGPAAKANPLRFSTQYADDVTGQVKYLFRDYDPDRGRWLNRDPIGEVGGNNLYNFVGNDPIRRIDSLGLLFWGCSRNPCADPCGDAKRKGLGAGSYGFVVCCGGKKYSCVNSPGVTTNKKAQKIATACITEHENDHHDDIDCPPGPGVTQPPYKSGKDPNAEECSAYKKHLACLQSHLKDCGGDPACEKDVQAEISRVEGRIRQTCGGTP